MLQVYATLKRLGMHKERVDESKQFATDGLALETALNAADPTWVISPLYARFTTQANLYTRTGYVTDQAGALKDLLTAVQLLDNAIDLSRTILAQRVMRTERDFEKPT